MAPLPKPFVTLLCYDVVIWAALLALIGFTVGGDPFWLAAIGIGGVGFTTWAAWFATRAHELMDSTRDMVWTLHPQRNKVGDLVARIRFFGTQLCEDAGLEFRFVVDLDKKSGDRPLDPESRRHLYLFFKEALSNAIRHSGGTTVSVRFEVRGGVLQLEVQDDGRGFSLDARRGAGHGLANMKLRAESLGGEVVIADAQPSGSTIRLRVPLEKGVFTRFLRKSERKG